MLTIDKLRELGVKPEEGLERCLNNENFYLNLVGKALDNDSVESLDALLKNGDLEEGFKIAHSLKGVYGNLSLTPLYDDVVELTELLRNKMQVDYSPYMMKFLEKYNKFKELL